MSVGDQPILKKLTELTQGQQAIVAKLKLEEQEAHRLDELGLHIGAAVKVIDGTANGYLVAVGDGRIAVNEDTAKHIYVY